MQSYKSDISVPNLWLRCLVAGHFTSERLLVEMRSAEFQISFWEKRLRQGGNSLFLLLSRGPLKFFQAIARFLHIRTPLPQLTAADSIEQRVHSSLCSATSVFSPPVITTTYPRQSFTLIIQDDIFRIKVSQNHYMLILKTKSLSANILCFVIKLKHQLDQPSIYFYCVRLYLQDQSIPELLCFLLRTKAMQ